MRLIDSMMEEFEIINKVRTSDGEAGFTTQWVPGAKIQAAVVLDSTMEATIGQAQGVTSVYKVTTRKDVALEYHEVIKRVRDGKIFRITSDANDMVSPEVSSLDMAQVKAEKWSLTS